jgi:hypothetical protein
MRTFLFDPRKIAFLLLMCLALQVSAAGTMPFCKHAPNSEHAVMHCHHDDDSSSKSQHHPAQCDHCQACSSCGLTNSLIIFTPETVVSHLQLSDVHFYHFISDALHRPPLA